MNLEQLTLAVRSAVGEESNLRANVTFDFGDDGRISIDGRSKPNKVSNDGIDADVALTLSMETFAQIIIHKLSPQTALMTGKMRLKGDMQVALRLNPVFGVS